MCLQSKKDVPVNTMMHSYVIYLNSRQYSYIIILTITADFLMVISLPSFVKGMNRMNIPLHFIYSDCHILENEWIMITHHSYCHTAWHMKRSHFASYWTQNYQYLPKLIILKHHSCIASGYSSFRSSNYFCDWQDIASLSLYWCKHKIPSCDINITMQILLLFLITTASAPE